MRRSRPGRVLAAKENVMTGFTRSLGLTLAIALTLGLATTASAAPAPDAAAVELVNRNFAAIAKGKTKTARALWAKEAYVELTDALGNPTKELTIDTALPRWVKHRKNLQWTIGRTEATFDGGFDVYVTV